MSFEPEHNQGRNADAARSGRSVPFAWILVLLLTVTLLLVFLVTISSCQVAPPGGHTDGKETGSGGESITDSGDTAPRETETSDEPVAVTYPYAIVLRRDSYLPMTGMVTYHLSTGAIGSTNAIIVDLDTLVASAELGADERIYPASMTKIMTLMVACDAISDLKAKVTVSKESIEFAQSHGASMAGFIYAGETCTVEDLLYGVAVKSGAEATYMLVQYIAGSEEAFVERMNAKCRELGLTKTHFSNSVGLHSTENYTTVREMAAIFACALDNELCRKLLSTDVYRTEVGYVKDDGTPATYHLTMYNTLLQRMETLNSLYGKNTYKKELPNGMTVTGSKTGYIDYTDAGGYHKNFTLATYATDGKKTYLVVTAGATATKVPLDDYQYLYKNFTD